MGGVGVEKYWNPKLFIENIQGEPSRLKVWHSVSKDSQGRAFISEKAVLSARFTENMELQCFPLDTQVSLHQKYWCEMSNIGDIFHTALC